MYYAMDAKLCQRVRKGGFLRDLDLVVSSQCRPIERCTPNCNPLCCFPDDTQARSNAMRLSLLWRSNPRDADTYN